MKKLFLTTALTLFLFFTIFILELNAQAQPDFIQAQPDISMDFQDANLKDILKALSIQAQMNFIASEAVQDRKVTLYLDKVPLNQAMDKIFKANNLSYELDKDANIFVVKDWGKMGIETVTKVFYLKHASVSSSALQKEKSSQMSSSTGFSSSGGSSSGSTSGSSSSSGSGSSSGSSGSGSSSSGDSGITAIIKKLLSSNGSIVEDSRTNSLIVTDTPAKMEMISKIIASLDLPVAQVLLEVEMLDVSKNVVDSLGFEFGSSPFTAIITGATASMGFPYGSWTKFMDKGKGQISINPTANAYQVQLDFLRTQSDTKFLARPKILTLNNETAEIRIATNESIGLTTVTTSTEGIGTTTAEPERSETGVILRVTPQINEDNGEITMFVYPRIAEAVSGNTFIADDAEYQYRDPEERSTKSVVRIKDGETVVLGGLIRNEYSRQTKKLPFFADIPIIGLLFRHIGGSTTAPDKDKQRELLVFITPRIIKDKADVRLAEIKNIQLPIREQGMAVNTPRDLIINSNMNKFEKNINGKR